jgi:hypothetical protein
MKFYKIFLIAILTLFLIAMNLEAKPRQAYSIVPGKIGTVLFFVSSKCPCTDQHRLMVIDLLEKTRGQGIEYYCVFSNPKESSITADYFFRNIGWDMPYVIDTKGLLADKYAATHTPQTILMTRNGQVVYRGPIDDSSQNQGRVLHAYVKDKIEQMIAGEQVQFAEIPPLGCWIVKSK